MDDCDDFDNKDASIKLLKAIVIKHLCRSTWLLVLIFLGNLIGYVTAVTAPDSLSMFGKDVRYPQRKPHNKENCA